MGSGHARSSARVPAADSFVRQRLIVAHQAAEMIAECDHAGTGQGRHVDDGGGLKRRL